MAACPPACCGRRDQPRIMRRHPGGTGKRQARDPRPTGRCVSIRFLRSQPAADRSHGRPPSLRHPPRTSRPAAGYSSSEPAPAHAQAFPNKPVRLVVPFPPGGPLDTVGRAHRAEADRGLGPERGRRQPAGRRRQHRRRPRRQGGARRLHGGDGRAVDPRGQPQPVREDALRRGQGLRADHAGRDHAERAGGQPVAAGQFGPRTHRLRQGQSRQARVRVGQQRQRRPPRRRALQGRHRHRPPARPVQGRARRRCRRCSPATSS